MQNCPGEGVLRRELWGPAGRRSNSRLDLGSLSRVDVAKALVLLADSHTLETCFAQVTGLTARCKRDFKLSSSYISLLSSEGLSGGCVARLSPSSAHLLDLGDEKEILPCFKRSVLLPGSGRLPRGAGRTL